MITRVGPDPRFQFLGFINSWGISFNYLGTSILKKCGHLLNITQGFFIH